MEYVEGQTIPQYADSLRLPYDKRLRLLKQVAEAVDYAHQQGIVHRDLKPSNIFVDASGQVKLLDFGIAAWQQRDDEMKDREIVPTVAMSPAYASPEQARGENTSKATDIYSFAMVAYELLAGVLPFNMKGEPLESVLKRIGTEMPAPPSVAVRRSTDPEPMVLGKRCSTGPAEMVLRLEESVDRPILRALSKNPAERPHSANELVDAMTIGSQPRPLRERAWAKAKQESFTALGIVVFLLLVAAGDLTLTPFGWIVSGIGAALLISWRSGALVHPWPVMFGLIAFVLPVAWGAARPQSQGVSSGKMWFEGVNALIGAIVIIRYLSRSFRLGPVIAHSRHVSITLLRVIVVLLLAWKIFESKTPTGFAYYSILFLCAILWGTARFEIRQKGVSIGLESLDWRELKGFRWISESRIAFHSKQPFLAEFGQRGSIHPRDVPVIRKALRNQLIELTPDET
jgi:hypothetical protein